MNTADVKSVHSSAELLKKARIRQKDFLSNKVILIENANIDVDYDFLSLIESHKILKKMNSNHHVTDTPLL